MTAGAVAVAGAWLCLFACIISPYVRGSGVVLMLIVACIVTSCAM